MENHQIPTLKFILINYDSDLNMTNRDFLNSSNESILLGHIYDMITNDSMTGHTVKNNRRSRDTNGPIGNVY